MNIPLLHLPDLSFPCDALYRIEADGPRPFTAGLTAARDGMITSCAPILRRLFCGMDIRYACDECDRRGWRIELVVRHG